MVLAVSNESRENERRDKPPELAEAIFYMTRELHEIHRAISTNIGNNAILNRIAEMETHIMSKVSEYTDRVGKAFDAISSTTDSIATSVTNVSGDISELKRIIAELQLNTGPISAEDQALLDALEAKVDTLVTKTQGVADAVAVLDAQTEPPAPPV